MDDLRRMTVQVLLAVLVFTVIGEFLDAWFFHNSFDGAVPIITLVGGMVSGLFAPELLRSRRNGNGETKKVEEPQLEKEAAIGDVPISPADGL